MRVRRIAGTRLAFPRGVLTLAALILAVMGGCSRAHHRRAADRQVYRILSQKGQDRRWSVPRLDVTPDPRSRFFDPTNPDCPPLPPDDPAAQQYMECVYGMRGAKRWDKLGRLRSVENPGWLPSLTGTQDAADGSLPRIQNLTLVGAIELSLIHSREYQTQLENLYLAALNLTFERYQFDLRPSGFLGEPGSALFYQHQPNDRSDLLLGPSHFGIRKLFPTGAQFIAELANDTLWVFSGPNSTGTATTLAYSLVQPLLLGAGREIVLENLTQSERDVLYAMRDFARFRKTFFVNTVTGGQVAGLQRFLRGFEFLAREGETPSVGFFPLLLRLQQVRYREENANGLEAMIEEFRAREADSLHIAQLESGLSESRGLYITEQRQLQDRTDQYKVQLGLPPDLDVSFDSSLVRPFQFIDPALRTIEDHLRDFGRQASVLSEPVPADVLQELLTELERLHEEVSGGFDMLAHDVRSLDEILPEKLRELSEDQQRQLAEDLAPDRVRLRDLRDDYERAARRIATMRTRLQTGPLTAAEQNETFELIRQIQRGLLLTVRRLGYVQASVRVELIPVQPAILSAAEAVDIGLDNRLDLMNQRASVVDGRRQMEVVADALESTVDVVTEGELRTPPVATNDNPFKFRGGDSVFRVGLRLTSPLDRRAERNDYRAAQIAYQRARRNYMAAEDIVKLDVRQSVRTLRELKERFDIRRRGVRFAAREVDLAQSQPPERQSGLAMRRALRFLRRTQTDTVEAWLDYEITRLNLFRDMGTMPIDRNGLWRDSFYQQMDDEGDLQPAATTNLDGVIHRLPPLDPSSRETTSELLPRPLGGPRVDQ